MKLVIIGGATLFAALALSTAASAGECRDPWVTTAIYELTGHKPRGAGESLDCNVKLYGNGSWSSYPDLFAKVKASYRDPGAPAAISVPKGTNAATISPNAQPATPSMTAAGMVAAGGGNNNAPRVNGMVAAGGGN